MRRPRRNVPGLTKPKAPPEVKPKTPKKGGGQKGTPQGRHRIVQSTLNDADAARIIEQMQTDPRLRDAITQAAQNQRNVTIYGISYTWQQCAAYVVALEYLRQEGHTPPRRSDPDGFSVEDTVTGRTSSGSSYETRIGRTGGDPSVVEDAAGLLGPRPSGSGTNRIGVVGSSNQLAAIRILEPAQTGQQEMTVRGNFVLRLRGPNAGLLYNRVCTRLQNNELSPSMAALILGVLLGAENAGALDSTVIDAITRIADDLTAPINNRARQRAGMGRMAELLGRGRPPSNS